MVEGDKNSTLYSNSIRDKRPHLYLARGRIWNVLKWKGKGKTLMLEVRSSALDETVFHFTCPQAIINSALNGELFATMKNDDNQMILQVGEMGEEYAREAMEEFYFDILCKKVEETKNKQRLTITRYGNGIRVTIDDEDDCCAIFFTTINDEYEEEDEDISINIRQ